MRQKPKRSVVVTAVAVALALAAAGTKATLAQSPLTPKMSLGGPEKRKLTPEEQEKQDRLERDYKAATAKIPDQQVTDPWATVRPTPTPPAPALKKKKAP